MYSHTHTHTQNLALNNPQRLICHKTQQNNIMYIKWNFGLNLMLLLVEGGGNSYLALDFVC